MWVILLLALLFTPTPPPGEPIGTPTPTPHAPPSVEDFRATWDGSGRAVITWETDVPLLCVGKHSAAGVWTFLDCAGSPITDPSPAPGDRYTLMAGGGWVLARADLQARLYIPLVWS